MILERTEIIWAAGFFDGEGCTFVDKRKTLYISVEQTSSNKEVLWRFKNAIGVGKVTTRRSKNTLTGFRSLYHCSNKDVQFVISLLYPFLSSVKRIQADKAINARIEFISQKKMA